jgi:hypothetical protein
MAQGLLDIGASAATVRFVAIGAAEGSRGAVTGTLFTSLAFYTALSALGSGLLLFFGDGLVGLVPYLDDAATASSVHALINYTAAAFVLTNGVTLLAAVLQGLGRVDTAYRDQTFGWIAYIPVLAGGFTLGWGIDAVGGAWIVAYGIQIVLLAVHTSVAVRRLPAGPTRSPGLRSVWSLGARWQVSSWADFATFQLPRLIGGVLLSSSGLVALDVAMRGAQLVVAPFFAAYPLVLPAAAAAWTREGDRGVALRLGRWLPIFGVALLLTTALAVPLLPPALTVWTGISLTSTERALSGFIVLGTVAHASTGPITSALLATGNVGLVVGYKLQQLVLAALLLPTLGRLGLLALGGSLAFALTVPAALFLRRVRRELGLIERGQVHVQRRNVALAAAACFAIPFAAIAAIPPGTSSLVTMSIGLAAASFAVTVAVPVSGARRLIPRSDAAHLRLGATERR